MARISRLLVALTATMTLAFSSGSNPSLSQALRQDELGIELMDAAGHENDIHFSIQGLQTFHQLEAIHLGHLNIENGEIGLKRLRQADGFAR